MGNFRTRGGREPTAISKAVKGSREITNEVSAKGTPLLHPLSSPSTHHPSVYGRTWTSDRSHSNCLGIQNLLEKAEPKSGLRRHQADLKLTAISVKSDL